jgi:hypothetical protein
MNHLRLLPRASNLAEDLALGFDDEADSALMINYITLDEQVSLV